MSVYVYHNAVRPSTIFFLYQLKVAIFEYVVIIIIISIIIIIIIISLLTCHLIINNLIGNLDQAYVHG